MEPGSVLAWRLLNKGPPTRPGTESAFFPVATVHSHAAGAYVPGSAVRTREKMYPTFNNCLRGAANGRMDKTIRKYTNFDEMKADEYREWQALPGYVRLNAIVELSLAQYQLKEPTRNVRQRLQRTLVHLQRPQS